MGNGLTAPFLPRPTAPRRCTAGSRPCRGPSWRSVGLAARRPLYVSRASCSCLGLPSVRLPLPPRRVSFCLRCICMVTSHQLDLRRSCAFLLSCSRRGRTRRSCVVPSPMRSGDEREGSRPCARSSLVGRVWYKQPVPSAGGAWPREALQPLRSASCEVGQGVVGSPVPRPSRGGSLMR